MKKLIFSLVVLTALVVSSCSTADSIDEIQLTDQQSDAKDGNVGSDGSGSDDPFGK